MTDPASRSAASGGVALNVCCLGDEYAPAELAERRSAFRDHEFLLIEASGHMVHYDAPDQLAGVSHDFLRRRYE